ncbi:unnamed protein product [Anisakis simplex]|uniref:Uncharacterized protein n=1 Tax=Anisakis simplex TaxID=6269 RepID=A0A3P6PG27_ANISI|nr:unnamed protein product [Anisakis simplex]
MVGDSGSEKDNVRRAYVQLSSNLVNQAKSDKSPVLEINSTVYLQKGTFEKIDVLDANVITVQGIQISSLLQIELLSAERISDFERIPSMLRCSHLDAIIIFYNINSLKQFESIHQKWIPTIRRLYRNTPFVICATGIEARLPREVRQLLLKKQLGEVETGQNHHHYS